MFCCCAEDTTKARVIEEDSDFCFVAKLSRQDAGEPLGLKMDFADEQMIYVCRVTAEGSSAVSRYNASMPQDRQIKVGDYFSAVNGVSAKTVPPGQKVSEALRDELLNSHMLEITVTREEVFECKIQKNGKPAGLELIYSSNGHALIVMKVMDGAVKSSAPEVKPGDRIVAVGSVAGSPESLLGAIRNAGDTMNLRMSRPMQ